MMVRILLILVLPVLVSADTSGLAEEARLGRIDAGHLPSAMEAAFVHDELLTGNPLIDFLHVKVADGTLTGYDIRLKDIYQGKPGGRGFIYSQSSLVHMKELITLLKDHNLQGDFYLTPKISAFVFREGWGDPGPTVTTLPSGLRLVNGREFAAMFEFDDAGAIPEFRQLIDRYAKRDSEDEQGLIADSWWQPFYYIDQPFEDFQQIDLIVVSSGKFEATLTVLPLRTDVIVEGMYSAEESDIDVRVDRVWVNPSFYRYLHGDHQ